MTHVEPIVGRYLHLEVDGTTYRTYYEEAGSGLPLLCMHTAGGDSRQYRHMMNDPEITENFRLIAFDMPRHGRTLPPDGTYDDRWAPTVDFLLRFTNAFTDALDLDRPALLGTSMGGYIALYMAVHHPGRYRALISTNPRAYADNWPLLNSVLDNPNINSHSFSTVIKSLISAESPHDRSREVEWVYNQAGPGVLAGDFAAAAGPGADVREAIKSVTPGEVGLYVIGGDWDISCLPAHTQELIDAMPGLPVIRVPELGHFGTAENPDAFRKVLLPVLEEIRAKVDVTT